MYFDLYCLAIAACVLLVAQMILRKHFLEFPWFFAAVSSSGALGLAGLTLGTSSPIYCQAYWAHGPLDLLLSIMATREIVQHVYRKRPGLRWFWRDNLLLSGLASILLALIIFPFTNKARAACNWLQCGFAAFLETETILEFANFIFSCTAAYMVRRWTPGSPGLWWHSALWSAYLGMSSYNSIAFILLRPTRGEEWFRSFDLMSFCANILLFSCWVVLMNRASLTVDQAPESEPIDERLLAFNRSVAELASDAGVRHSWTSGRNE